MKMFTPMRTVAALLVIYTHAFALVGDREPTFAVFHNMLGTTGVMFLVGISGYLIAASWERRPNAGAFWAKRLLRLLPGLFVSVTLCVFILGPLVTTESTAGYFGDVATYAAWFKASLLWTFNFALPGVFENVKYGGEVNGSLWTLPLEAFCYLMVFVAGLTGLLKRPRVVLALVVAALLVLLIGGLPSDDPLIAKPEGFERLLNALKILTLFGSGTVMYLYRDRIPLRASIAVAIVVVYVLPLPQTLHDTLATALVPYLAVYVGTRNAPAILARLTPNGADPSYGIYIYAFPLQQTIVFLEPDLNPWLMTLIAMPAAYAIGRVSWVVVERPMLSLRDRFGTATPVGDGASPSPSSAPSGSPGPVNSPTNAT